MSFPQPLYTGDWGLSTATTPVATVTASAALSAKTASFLNATSASVIGTLPAVALATDLWVQRTDSTGGHTATVAAAEGAGTLINGVASFTLVPGVAYLLASSGTAWSVVSIGNSPNIYGKFSTSTASTTQVLIPHGLGVIPSYASAQSANTATLTPLNVTVDITNIQLNFTSALTNATAYAWWYQARV